MPDAIAAAPPLIGFDAIEAAAARLAGQIDNTPFLHSETLSRLTGAHLRLKFENLQYTASFKQRGALNKLLTLSPDERASGVVAVSAGNHAQGVAYHAGLLGIPATILMPRTTPQVKAGRTREFGAEVILAGDNFAEASALVPELVAARGLTLVHPYDDDMVIAGQGTVGLEMLAAADDLDALVVAVGGGGLIAGVATAARHLHPGIEIVGVQSERFPAMARHLGRWSGPVAGGASIAEGIAVATPGARTRHYAERLVDDMLVVSERRIEEAIAALLQIEKTLCEGAGAAGLAAVLAYPDRFAGKRVGLILCGGNIDNRLLTAVLQRQLMRDGRLLRLSVRLPDQAGSLGTLCSLIGEAGGNINTVAHDRTWLDDDAKSARVDVEIEVPEAEIAGRVVAALEAAGYAVDLRPAGGV